MNRDRERIEKFGEFRPYIANKKDVCGTFMEYLKMGLFGAYPFKA